MKLLPVLTLFFSVGVTVASASDLSPEQVEAIKKRIESLQSELDGHLSSRNSNAGERFARAASDPGAAVELYPDCDRLGVAAP